MKVEFLHSSFTVKMLQQKVRGVEGQFAFGPSGGGFSGYDCWEMRHIAKVWEPGRQIWERKENGAEKNLGKDEDVKGGGRTSGRIYKTV